LAGCTTHGSQEAPAPTLSGPPYTLRVLASSELTDLQPVLNQAAHATGVSVKLTPTDSQIMSSPVVVSVRASVARKLGWDHTLVSWSDIAAAAGKHQFSFGMEDPGRSDPGLSALVGVATAAAGDGSPLKPAEIAKAAPTLRELLSGQSLREPTSADLTSAYIRSQASGAQGGPVDGLITYESELLSLNASGSCASR
jgi:Ca-activated chloride channel family protein